MELWWCWCRLAQMATLEIWSSKRGRSTEIIPLILCLFQAESLDCCGINSRRPTCFSTLWYSQLFDRWSGAGFGQVPHRWLRSFAVFSFLVRSLPSSRKRGTGPWRTLCSCRQGHYWSPDYRKPWRIRGVLSRVRGILSRRMKNRAIPSPVRRLSLASSCSR